MENLEGAEAILQNRNRATPASISQMQSIAANPDYKRMSISRDFANGAPVVAGGDIPAAQLGRNDTVVTSKGRRISVQYAVLEASDVVASNSADGLANAEYGDASRTRAIAGNGRIAGLQAAYGMGTTGDYVREYVQELAEDDLHGVAPDVIRGMKSPVLVRVMQSADITLDIGDESNTTGNLELTAVEQAKNDLHRIDLEALQFNEDGSISGETLRGFVRAMPTAEQGRLIDSDTGQPSIQAVHRLNAAIFARAYSSDQLVRLYAQAQDPEARVILSALAQVAPKMARLDGIGWQFDVRSIITEAAEIAVNARRDGIKLTIAARQGDLNAEPKVHVVLDMFARNSRSAKAIKENLGNMADFAYTEANKVAVDMFGETPPRASRNDVINTLKANNERAIPGNVEQPSRGEPSPGNDGRQETERTATAVDRQVEPDQPTEPGVLREEQTEEVTNPPFTEGVSGSNIQTESRADDPPAIQGDKAQPPAAEDFLTSPTRQDVINQQHAAKEAQRLAQKAQQELEEKARKEAEYNSILDASKQAASTFVLGGDAIDNLNSQQDIFGAPTQAGGAPQSQPNPLERLKALANELLGRANATTTTEIFVDDAGKEFTKTQTVSKGKLDRKQYALWRDVMGIADSAMPVNEELESVSIRLTGKYVGEGRNYIASRMTFKPIEVAPEVLPSQSAPAKPGETVQIMGKAYPVTTYITNRGNALRGVWVPNQDIAYSVTDATFKKTGMGWFIRERDFPRNQVQQTVAEYRSRYVADLFGNPLPESPGTDAAKKWGSSGNPPSDTDTPAPPGDYYVRTTIGTKTKRTLGAKRINGPEDLARATSYLYRSAVEQLDGVVTDKNGTPLAVVGGFKGNVSSVNIYPGTLVAEAIRIPGAAHIWFSHNHPTGGSMLSDADIRLAREMRNVFTGSGIEPMGLIAIARDKFSFSQGYDDATNPKPFEKSNEQIKVPVIERELSLDERVMGVVSDPTAAKSVATRYYNQAKEPGLMLVNPRNAIAAWVPLSKQMTGLLRNTGGLNALYRAISESNAKGVIIVHGGELDKPVSQGVTISQNIAAAMHLAEVNALDSINVATGKSTAEDQTMSVVAGLVYARGGQTDQTETPAFKAWFGDSKVVDTEGKPLVAYHGTVADIAAFWSKFAGSNTPNSGMYGRGAGYFTNSSDIANAYAQGNPERTVYGKGQAAPTFVETPSGKLKQGANVMPVFISIKNPLEVQSHSELDAFIRKIAGSGKLGALSVTAALKALGYDGVIVDGGKEIVPFSPEQIKSAIGNNGNFDPVNPDIRMARPLGDASGQATSPGGAGMPLEAVQRVVDAMAAKWTNGPAIKVVQSTSDLPSSSATPADVRGMLHAGTAYVVATNQSNAADVQRTLAHEAIGHYGLWQILGEDGKREFVSNIQQALVSGNKQLQALSDHVRATYVDEDGKFNLSKASEADEIAALAVERALDGDGNFRPGFGFLKEVWARIAEFLRELGFTVPFTNAELQGMLVAATKGLEAGQRLEGRPRNAKPAFLRGWHGSPHIGITKFSTDKIGTGEGAQAYGWGLYFASKKEIAEHYRERLSKRIPTYNGDVIDSNFYPNEIAAIFITEIQIGEHTKDSAISFIKDEISTSDKYEKQRLDAAIQFIEKIDLSKFGEINGQLYEVEIPAENEFLLWDKPLSEQPDAALLRDIAKEEDMPMPYQLAVLAEGRTGKDFYKALSSVLGNDQAASRVLDSYGIKGIKYLDGVSRSAGDGSHNYVVFSGDDVEIVAAYARGAQTEPDTKAPAGKYHYRTIIGSETQRTLGATRIVFPKDLARATSYLYSSAVERFDGIVTDRKGKPLAVVGGFKGALTETSVYPSTLVGEAIRIPGASSIWFSHNHPSGSSTLSEADHNLALTLTKVFEGSGIDPRGFMAISNGRFSFTDSQSEWINDVAFEQGTEQLKVPVMERQLARSEPGDNASSPEAAMVLAKRYYQHAKGPGLMLLDAQLRVAAWVPISEQMTGKLRYTGGLNAVYRAISEGNARSAIIVHGGELDGSITLENGRATEISISQNIAAALQLVDVQALDSINAVTGKSASKSLTENIADGPVFARGGQTDFQDRVVAAQDLASLVRSTGQRLKVRSDGYVILYHSTSNKYAESINKSGIFKGNTWFSASKSATMEHARPKHGSNTETLEIPVDPRTIEFSTGTGEFYAPNGLYRDANGYWSGTDTANPDIRMARQLTEDSFVPAFLEFANNYKAHPPKSAFYGQPRQTSIDLSRPQHAAKMLQGYLEFIGMKPTGISSSGSGSFYLDFNLNGEIKSIRLSDHPQPSTIAEKYGSVDYDIFLFDPTEKVNVRGNVIVEYVSEKEALNRMDEFIARIANESTVVESDSKTMARPLGDASGQATSPGGAGMPLEDVQRVVDAMATKWTNGPAIKVVQSTSDLPSSSATPADVRGMLHAGTAYVVATNQRNAADVQRTLAHEAIGHYGLWQILGEDGKREFVSNIQQALASGNKQLQALSDHVRATYVDEDGKFNLSKASEADEIAALAVERALDGDGNFRPGFGFLKEVWARIAEFLRELGFTVPFTNAELQGMLVAATKGLEAGHRLEGMPRNAKPAFLRGWHGSPHVGITKFSTDKIGTGEGAQAYGYGLYFSSMRDVAEHYRRKLTTPDGEFASNPDDSIQVRVGRLRQQIASLKADDSSSARSMIAAYEARIAELDRSGQTYEVEIPEEREMLLWDKPLSEQPEAVRAALEGNEAAYRPDGTPRNMKGDDLYEVLIQEHGSDRAASEYLASLGIKGIKYLDGVSRRSGDGSHNYVVFSGDDVEIVAAYARGGQTDQTKTPQFKAWFGNSKAAYAYGEPIRLYHETSNDFSEFKIADGPRSAIDGEMPTGAFFKPTPRSIGVTNGGEVQMPVYLSLQNPLFVVNREELKLLYQDVIPGYRALSEQDAEINARWRDDPRVDWHVNSDEEQARFDVAIKEWQAETDAVQAEQKVLVNKWFAKSGYDGLIVKNDAGSMGRSTMTYVAFRPEQIKSAIGNNGNFDPVNPDIRMARPLGDASGQATSPGGAGMPLEDVQRVVDAMAAKWTNGPAIKVVQSTSDLPSSSATPADVRGMLHAGTAYVVATNQRNAADVQRTLAHEAIGHYGLWQILGEDGKREFVSNIQQALASGNKQLQALSDHVRATYVDDNGNFNLSKASEADEIAALAVERALDGDGNFRPGFGFLKEVWARIAEFLRELGFTVPFTNAELQGMLVAATKGLEAGHRLGGGADLVVAAARDGSFNRGESGSLLTSYTPQEALKKQKEEEAARKAEDAKPQAPRGRKVTGDQVDLFNPQDSLFSRGGNTYEGYQSAAKEKMEIENHIHFLQNEVAAARDNYNNLKNAQDKYQNDVYYEYKSDFEKSRDDFIEKQANTAYVSKANSLANKQKMSNLIDDTSKSTNPVDYLEEAKELLQADPKWSERISMWSNLFNERNPFTAPVFDGDKKIKDALQKLEYAEQQLLIFNQLNKVQDKAPKIRRLYHGGHYAGFTEVPAENGYKGAFDGLFALSSSDAWRAFGNGNNYYADIPDDKILTNYVLNYELDYKKVLAAFTKVTGIKKRDKNFADAWYAIVEDPGNDNDRAESAGLTDKILDSPGLIAQKLRGRLSRELGFSAVEMKDEMGTSYLIAPGVPLTQYYGDRDYGDDPAFARGGPTDVRRTGFDKASGTVLADFRDHLALKGHPDYQAAKAGDLEAALRLVQALTKPESLEFAKTRFGSEVIYLPVHAEEATGRNAIPVALAAHYAAHVGAAVDAGVVQSNRAFHTGANAMERLVSRASFTGEVQAGKRYVLVDDVTTMGSTLADLAGYVRAQKGEVAGSVLLANASRSGIMEPSVKTIKELEARHANQISKLFSIEPGALTRSEAEYLIGFRTTDELRGRVIKAGQTRQARHFEKDVAGTETGELTRTALRLPVTESQVETARSPATKQQQQHLEILERAMHLAKVPLDVIQATLQQASQRLQGGNGPVQGVHQVQSVPTPPVAKVAPVAPKQNVGPRL